jgi:hypothetical protein
MDDECMMTVMMVVGVVMMYSLLPQTSPILASVGGSSVNSITKHKIKEERRKLMSVYCWPQSNCVG